MKETDSELCNPCHNIYIQTCKQQPKVEHINLRISETTTAKLHAICVDELEVESGKSKERVIISIYLCTDSLYTQAEDIFCQLKTPQWQKIINVQRLLSSGTYNPIECDENDLHIASVCEKVIKNIWICESKDPLSN